MTDLIEKSGQNLEAVKKYYNTEREYGNSQASIYKIWETGGAFQDSITPSTFTPEYRSHIVLKILSLSEPGDKILSLGCGNGFVEADIVKNQRRVHAIDFNAEAVELTLAKGVSAEVGDFFKLEHADIEDVKIIYADGLVGHLFSNEEKLLPFIEKLKSLDLNPETLVILSNDSPMDPDKRFMPHARVEGFWFLSKHYLLEQLVESGFKPVESYYFPYIRPVSGLRNRTMCIVKHRPW